MSTPITLWVIRNFNLPGFSNGLGGNVGSPVDFGPYWCGEHGGGGFWKVMTRASRYFTREEAEAVAATLVMTRFPSYIGQLHVEPVAEWLPNDNE